MKGKRHDCKYVQFNKKLFIFQEVENNRGRVQYALLKIKLSNQYIILGSNCFNYYDN